VRHHPPAVAVETQRGRRVGLVQGDCGLIQRARRRGSELTGPNRTDRGKTGSKHHVLTDAQGVPLVAQVSAANVHDGAMLMELVGAIPPVAGRVGAP